VRSVRSSSDCFPYTTLFRSYNEVGPGFFGAVGMKLLAGREFTRADSRDAPRVAVVNEAFAKKFNLGRDAVGKFMSTNGRDTLNRSEEHTSELQSPYDLVCRL